VAETTTPLDRLVDLLVYAPVGLALTVKDDLSAIVERGRRSVAPQVQVARFMGRLAVSQATRAANDLVEDAIGRMMSPAPGANGSASPAGAPEPERATHNGRSAPVGTPSPDETGLAIPGYDSLSAAHVVQRLDGLTDPELDDVRRYEQAHRARRTVLFKIDQLQAGRA
jgi:hypothetical protein